ncbi:unnamed protein product [Owenia fusiformis]|uniref:Uncharacterized protein n=1 Tax=Owenia fusiformis TaxID=6347 RepID=A0A8J1XVK2_OWEFU|nr:unnamed protein product [Owenia fusiformis]
MKTLGLNITFTNYFIITCKIIFGVRFSCARVCCAVFSFPPYFVAQARVNMQLFIRAQETHTVNVTGTETVGHVKAQIAASEGIAVEDQVVLYGGKPLEDATLLSSFDELSTIDVQTRMLGGKVHGSLARAGKVKGQTPKVEAQEKKKKRTGRAKRRMQYNRRFVNVVATFGRRRGPNSNAAA